MSVSNDWITTAAFIEYYVLEEALSRDVSIGRASRTVVPRFGLTQRGPFLHRETRILGMLYTLLIFPRERWEREGLMDIVLERALADKDLNQKNKNLISKAFIRHIRNAVAHARVEFDEDTITFRDRQGDTKDPFEETLSIRDATNLVLVLGRAFHESSQVRANLQNAVGSTP